MRRTWLSNLYLNDGREIVLFKYLHGVYKVIVMDGLEETVRFESSSHRDCELWMEGYYEQSTHELCFS